jgi:hypothetical protein
MPPDGGTSRRMKNILDAFLHSKYREKERAAPGARLRQRHDTCRNKVLVALPLRRNFLCTKANVSKRANGAEDQRRILFELSELCSRPERSELIQLKCPSKRAQGAARSGEVIIL